MNRGVFVVAALALSCGGGAGECPQNREACEGALDLRWRLLTGELDGFEESCGGVGATHVDLDLTGPTPLQQRFMCSTGQTLLTGLGSGDYEARITLVRVDDVTGDETVLTRAYASTAFPWEQRDGQIIVEVPFNDFVESYNGSWYFRPRWGDTGAGTCEAGGVVRYDLRLERDGAVIGSETNDGLPLDGSATGDCEDFAAEFAPVANGIPWGPAEATLRGYDADGQVIYRGTVPTFVGAGASNPDLELVVPAVDRPDAAPGPDAAPPDAGTPDAAVGVPDAIGG